ncbi:MAG: transcriptional regulator [Lachnospiraceae bacterium]|nr:transcriptional regulator [Lachnospiraceae bacterium]
MRKKSTENQIAPGYRIGHLTVVSDSHERKNGYVAWNCRCDCGREIKVDRRTLLRGTVTDCGCMTKVRPGQRDITGQRFGMLTARYCTGRQGYGGSYYWHCTCDCGGEIDASLHQLQAGYRKSCGCLSHPPLKDFVGKHFGQLTVTAYAGKYDGMHHWTCLCDCGKETVVGQTLLQSGKTKSCGCIRANIYKENLKLVAGTSVTILETVQRHTNAANVSGYTGVYLNRKANKWCAQIGFQGKTYYLGSYAHKEDAVKARKRGEEMHREFLNWYYQEYLPEKKLEIQTEGNGIDQDHPGFQYAMDATVNDQAGRMS